MCPFLKEKDKMMERTKVLEWADKDFKAVIEVKKNNMCNDDKYEVSAEKENMLTKWMFFN